MRPAVSYIRVSKPKQGRSGLGLEAQQAAIKTFCAQHGYKIEAEYREVETGKGADALERRPELAAAMKYATQARQRQQGTCRASHHRQAGPTKPRCSFHQRPDGAAGALHRHRARP